MKITGIALLALATLSVASADPVITTSATCYVFGETTVTSAGSCSLGTPPTQQPYPPYASATSSASVVLQQTASDWLTISMRVDANAAAGPMYGLDAASASGQNTIHVNFVTSGPERAGILELQWQLVWMGNPGDFEGTANYTMGSSYSGGCGGGASPGCVFPGPNAPPIRFELGTAFSFDSSNWLEVSTEQGNSAGYAGIDLQFRFLEADDFTPVLAISPPESVPEPATLALIGAGLLGCGWLRPKG
jgi:hypothetical protein